MMPWLCEVHFGQKMLKVQFQLLAQQTSKSYQLASCLRSCFFHYHGPPFCINTSRRDCTYTLVMLSVDPLCSGFLCHLVPSFKQRNQKNI
jgi:hypothetical protein